MIGYHHDPIFCRFDDLYKIKQYARQKKIPCYAVDPFPIKEWISSDCPITVTNSVITAEVPNSSNIFVVDSRWLGLYYHPYPLDLKFEYQKSYNCFMNRMDPTRQSWFYQLLRRDILQHGFVSFNMETTRLPPKYKDMDPHDIFQDQFEKNLSIFAYEHDILKHQVPYRNFDNNPDLTSVCYDSKISLVLETFFHHNDLFTYSEKIFRALQIPRPWVLFSNQYAVRHLKNLGFDVLDDIIDHAQYDKVEFDIHRQIAILDIMPDLIKKEFDPHRLCQAADHNQQLLKSVSTEWFDAWIETIDKAAQCA